MARDGKIRSLINGRVDEIILNPKIPDSMFCIEYGPGTVVDDMRDGGMYIIRKDGSARRILKSELGPDLDLDLLMTSNPPELETRSSFGWMGVNIVAVAALVAWCVYRNLHRKHIRTARV
jgi:hypothetical protein